MKPLRSSILIVIILIFSENVLLSQEQYFLEWSTEENSQIIPYTSDCPSVHTHECQKVKLDSENNVIVTGSSKENGNFDFLVVKYTNNGTSVWKQLIDISNESTDYLTGVFIDENDNIIVTGVSQWSDEESKSVIIKMNPLGEIIWESYFSDNYDWTFPQSLVVDSNGDIFLTGYINKNSSSREMFVCKFDTNGDYVWDDIYSFDDSGRYQGMTLRIIDDSIVSLGYFYSSFPLDKRVAILKHSKDGELLSSNETSFQGNFRTYHIDAQGNSYIGLFGDFKIIKYDQSGEEKWAFEVPNNLPDNVTANEVQDIISDNEGNVYITGRHYGENYGDTLNYTNGDLQVNKISPEGNSIYSYRYENLGTHAFDGGNKLFLGKYDYLTIGGQSQKMYVATDYDYVAIVIDNLGVPIDTLRYHEQGDEVIKSVTMDSDLNFYVTGTGNGNTLTQKYSFTGIVNTKDIAETDIKCKIYPNPFRNEFHIEIEDVLKGCEFNIFDSKGTLIYRIKLDDFPMQVVDANSIPNGFYFYQIISEGNFKSGKLMKN